MCLSGVNFRCSRSLILGIDPSQVPKLNNKSLFTYKNYVVLIVSENSAEIEQAFYNAVD